MPARTAKRRVDVRVFPPYRDGAPAPWVRRAAAAALDAADPGGARGVSVVVADDDTLLDLNRRFRGLDEVTDVLSFGDCGAAPEEGSALLGENAPPIAFPSVPGEAPSLGEVVLSYPYAARQAASRNAPVEREVALLIIHGALHLLGRDHAEPDEEAAMRAEEAAAMSALFPPAAETPPLSTLYRHSRVGGNRRSAPRAGAGAAGKRGEDHAKAAAEAGAR